jgi:hypothetical protein
MQHHYCDQTCYLSSFMTGHSVTIFQSKCCSSPQRPTIVTLRWRQSITSCFAVEGIKLSTFGPTRQKGSGHSNTHITRINKFTFSHDWNSSDAALRRPQDGTIRTSSIQSDCDSLITNNKFSFIAQMLVGYDRLSRRLILPSESFRLYLECLSMCTHFQ